MELALPGAAVCNKFGRTSFPASQTPRLLPRQGVLLSKGVAGFQLALPPFLGRLESSDPLGVLSPSSTLSGETCGKQPLQGRGVRKKLHFTGGLKRQPVVSKLSRLLGITCPYYHNGVSFGRLWGFRRPHQVRLVGPRFRPISSPLAWLRGRQ